MSAQLTIETIKTDATIRRACQLLRRYPEFEHMPANELRLVVAGTRHLFPDHNAAQLARNTLRFERTGSFTRSCRDNAPPSQFERQGAVDSDGRDMTFGSLVCRSHGSSDPAIIAERRELAEKISASLGADLSLCLGEGYSYSEAVELGAATCGAAITRRIAEVREKFAA
jgi:hypothetical protein